MAFAATLPATGFLRLYQIIGDPGKPESTPPIPPTPAIIPVSKSHWWEGIKKGIFPKGVKLSARCTAWRVEDIIALVERHSTT
jgi:predicted DNA-binding transcriptional regulator AlpA